MSGAPDLASLFLGPKGENADVLERLLLEALRDHVFWRRNFHPEDGFLVAESERRAPAYEESISRLQTELMGLLGALKEGVPFFSPRYVGHMCSDLTLASLVGYFAALLYNPNNVSAEASPVTTRLELEVAAQLAHMVGYAPERQWGHLTSGGSVANLEALWVARNVRYLPVALRWAAAEAGLQGLRFQGADGSEVVLERAELWPLLNVPPAHALDLADAFRARVGDAKRAASLLQRHTLGGLGYQEFGRRLADGFRDALPPAVVLVPSTAHYSWEKMCRVLGLGSAQLVKVPVDARFRMSMGALEDTLEALAARRQPVLACVSVMGTTEEGAVDRLDRVVELRERMGRERGLTFSLHADAAWGGYAAAITRDASGARRLHSAALADAAPEAWPDEGVYRALVALERTDSVTIDPHKLGYIPYPAGAVSFRDRRVRELVSVDAPYVFNSREEGSDARGADEAAGFGRYILEGSKPGAAAAAVWMSHRVLPLDASGYGRLVTDTARGARALQRRLQTGDWDPFRVLPLPNSDLNIVCFAVSHPSLHTLEEVNAFTERVHRALSAGGGRSARRQDFFVTRTTLRAAEYGGAVDGLLAELGFDAQDYARAGGLGVLRCTIMDPFLAQRRGKVDFLQAFGRTLAATFKQQLRPEPGA